MGKHAIYFLRESCCVMETSQNKLIVMVIHVVPKKNHWYKIYFYREQLHKLQAGSLPPLLQGGGLKSWLKF